MPPNPASHGRTNGLRFWLRVQVPSAAAIAGTAFFAVFALFTPFAVHAAQQTEGAPRVGVLSPQKSTEPPGLQREPFERGLRELGWTPGENIIIEYRYGEGNAERLPELAAELIRMKVDVIVARGAQATHAARQATRTIPIVMSAAPDPVRQGFVASLARPGGKITGLASLSVGELEEKRLELLKDTVPGLARVAYLLNPTAFPDPGGLIGKRIEAAARFLSLTIRTFEIRKPRDIPEAFAAIKRARVGALLVRPDPEILDPNVAQVVQLALEQRLPAMYAFKLYVDAGGLMSYGTSAPGFHYRSATFVDKILKGAKPADLPVEQPTRFELVVNLKTAKALDLTIPQSVLIRADHVIQ